MSTIGRTNPHAAQLRRDATNVEKRLWQSLRNRQLGGFKFRRQSTIGPFIVDFLCAEHGLIIELDGGQHSPEQDADRIAWLESRRFLLLRFWNHEVIENEEGVLTAILNTLERLAKKPSPNPLP
ncbi:MAG: endonuclease domain-containing protein [Alphaproteobacteria bacterium]|nr:MAG: endonuclease domain-containing protein [Alphaproteobacteria bacterium]